MIRIPKIYRFKENIDKATGEKYWYTTNWGFYVSGSISYNYDAAFTIFCNIVDLSRKKRIIKHTLAKIKT